MGNPMSTTDTATRRQIRHSMTVLKQAGLSAEDFTTLHDGYLADLAQAVKLGTLPDRETFRTILKLKGSMSELFRLIVDYNQTLEQMIDAGKYHSKNDDITPERFPLKGEGIVEVEACLFYFDHAIDSKDAIKAIEVADKDNPWSAGQIEHLLAFEVLFLEERRKFPVIGLGSVAKIDNDGVPTLWGGRSKRDLDLGLFNYGWYKGCRFLAVRKVSAA